MRVRLTANLTRYDPRLTDGQEGDTIGSGSHLGDHFTFVRFDCGAKLDVLWESIEVIDEAFLAAAKKRRDEEDIQLAQATDAVLHLGPNGGFKMLTYRLGTTRTTNGLKDKAARIMAVLKSHGIPIREERAERELDHRVAARLRRKAMGD
jgi:hypothetical protein